MPVVVVQRDPGAYWHWLVATFHFRAGFIAAVLQLIALSGVVTNPAWVKLLMGLAGLFGGAGLAYASAVQPPRAPIDDSKRAEIRAAMVAAGHTPIPPAMQPTVTAPLVHPEAPTESLFQEPAK